MLQRSISAAAPNSEQDSIPMFDSHTKALATVSKKKQQGIPAVFLTDATVRELNALIGGWIIEENLPFNIVTHPKFREMLQVLGMGGMDPK